MNIRYFIFNLYCMAIIFLSTDVCCYYIIYVIGQYLNIKLIIKQYHIILSSELLRCIALELVIDKT